MIFSRIQLLCNRLFSTYNKQNKKILSNTHKIKKTTMVKKYNKQDIKYINEMDYFYKQKISSEHYKWKDVFYE